MFKKIIRLSGCSGTTIVKNIAVAILDATTMVVPNFCIFFILMEMLEPEPSNTKLMIYCALIAACLVARLFSVWVSFITHSSFSSSAGYTMRSNLMDKLVKIPLGSLLSMDLGTINNTLLKDVEFSEYALSHVLSYMLGISCVLLLLMAGLFVVDWRLSLSMLIGFPVAISLFVWLTKLTQKGKRRLFQSSDTLNNSIFEFILGIRVLRAHGQAEGDMLALGEKMKQARDAHLKYEMGASLAPAAFVIFSEVGFASLILFGLYAIGTQTLSLSVFLLFLLVSMQFFRPLTQLAILLSQFDYFNVSLNRIDELLGEKELENKHSKDPQVSCYEIEFNDVCFAYEEAPLFEKVNVVFPEQAVTAIVGPSGSGKSTMMSLIARFWDTDNGNITIGGQNISEMSQSKIAQHVSMVFQEVYLFDDTVYNNLVMGQDISAKKLERVCRQAQCWEFIQSLPNGLETVVGEGGTRLSGGEKQRISIARALLKDAPIVLLDEATAALDSGNEVLIHSAISALIKDKTVIVITHHLSSVIKADKIVVLVRGEIEAVGVHDELMKISPTYQALWSDQLKAQGWQI